jgi:hypothetical protein
LGDSNKKPIFVSKDSIMTTIPMPHLQADEQFKAYLLKILVEDAVFAVQVKAVLRSRKPKQAKPFLAKSIVPVSEMPYWKLRPDFKPRDAKPYAIKKQTIHQLQTIWQDAPTAEELIAHL